MGWVHPNFAKIGVVRSRSACACAALLLDLNYVNSMRHSLRQLLTRSLSKFSGKVLPSIVLLLPFVLLALVGYRSYRERQKDMENLATKLHSEITDQIEDKVTIYVETPLNVNQANATFIELGQFNFIESGQFNLDDFRRLERLFSKQIQNFKQVNATYIGIANGDFFGAEWQQRQENKWTFIIDEQTADKFTLSQRRQALVLENYDPTKRPWYEVAAKSKCKQTWGEVYTESTTQKPAVTAAYPICDKLGKPIAVLGSEFVFPEVNEFLEKLKKNKLETGEIFITDRKGELLTTSSGSKSDRTKRTKATESEDTLIRKTAEHIEDKFNFSNIDKKQLDFTLDGKRHFLQVTPLTDEHGLDWLIVVVIPENDIIKGINANTRAGIWLDSVALILTTAGVMLAFHWMTLRAENSHLQHLAQQESEFYTAASRFVPRDFLDFLEKNVCTVELGDRVQKEMTIMFSDIRSFTQISEKMTPQENFNFINEYLGKVSPVIRNHGGIIDKYIGDAIMALFPQDSAEKALDAAIEMQCKLLDYNQHRQTQGYQPISIGIGLHAGSLMLGTIGEPERMETTVISDAVNLASRLEGLTKLYGAEILISGETFFKITSSKYSYRCLGLVRVKGRDESVSVVEVYNAEPPEIVQLKNQTKAGFESASLLYNQRDFTQANRIFQEILQINPQDRAAKMYGDRCDYYQEHGVPEDWQGIEDFNLVKK